MTSSSLVADFDPFLVPRVLMVYVFGGLLVLSWTLAYADARATAACHVSYHSAILGSEREQERGMVTGSLYPTCTE